MMPLSSRLNSRRVAPTSKKPMQASLRQRERASVHAATILDLFAQFPILDEICRCLDIGDIVCLTRTCRFLSTLYRSLLPSQWNVDKHLRRFVDRPLTFRHQMAICDALVSGSLALQFFERTTWSSSDLDIYVKANGSAIFSRYLCEEEGYVLADETNLADDYEDDGNEIAEIHTLVKKKRAGDEVKVQIVTVKTDPLICILAGFYTTLVVSFFSWEKAYSVFPRPTFIERRGYMLKEINERHAPLIAKYSRRGWSFQDVVWSGEPSVFALEGMRRAGDRHSWIIAFGTESIVNSAKPDHVLAYANFHIEKHYNSNWEGRGPTYYQITAKSFKAMVLRYQYVYASSSWQDFLGTRMDSLTTIELLKLQPRERPDWFSEALQYPIAHYCAQYHDDTFRFPNGWTYFDDDVPKWYGQWEVVEAGRRKASLTQSSKTS